MQLYAAREIPAQMTIGTKVVDFDEGFRETINSMSQSLALDLAQVPHPISLSIHLKFNQNWSKTALTRAAVDLWIVVKFPLLFLLRENSIKSGPNRNRWFPPESESSIRICPKQTRHGGLVLDQF